MEQRKRESLIPKGTFEIGAPLADDQRGDLSGTFLRSEVEPPPTPVARIELKRKVAPPPPPPAAARKSLRPTPPTLLPTVLPPPPPSRVPTTTPEAGSLRALVAPSYPPPAPPTADTDRIDFLEFALRLDVAPMPPPPSSLLPPPVEAPARSLRPVVMLLALFAVGAGGWLSRGWFAAPTQASPRPLHVVAPAPVIAPVAVAAPSVVEPTGIEPSVAEQVVAPSVIEPSMIEPSAVEPSTVEPASVAPAPLATRAPSVASTPRVAPVEQGDVEESPAVVEEAPVAIAETAAANATEAQADGEHAPAMVDAVAEALPETLEREEVVEGIEILRNEYQACAGDKHGTAEIKLTIANTGRITHALVGGDFAGTPQGSCLARTLRQARFRSFVQPRLDIAYPIAL